MEFKKTKKVEKIKATKKFRTIKIFTVSCYNYDVVECDW